MTAVVSHDTAKPQPARALARRRIGEPEIIER
jgi:hypothetical protein